jgi:hypothetical protein
LHLSPRRTGLGCEGNTEWCKGMNRAFEPRDVDVSVPAGSLEHFAITSLSRHQGRDAHTVRFGRSIFFRAALAEFIGAGGMGQNERDDHMTQWRY